MANCGWENQAQAGTPTWKFTCDINCAYFVFRSWSCLHQFVWHVTCVTIMCNQSFYADSSFKHLVCTGGATFYVSSLSKSGLFGKLGLDTKSAMAQQTEKRVQATKNSDPVNRIVKKKTSHCLIDTCSLRNVVEKHQSKMLRTATFIICPGSAGWLMQGWVYRELSVQREGALRSGRAVGGRKHGETHGKIKTSEGLWVVNTMRTHTVSTRKRWHGGTEMFYVPFQHLVGKMRERQRETH